jgi:transitional endoplasmic reticulum ATPase
VDIKSLARTANNLVGADIELICRNAALAAIREAIQSCKSDDAHVIITARHFEIGNEGG